MSREAEWISDNYMPHFLITIGYYYPTDHDFSQVEIGYVNTIIRGEILYDLVIGPYYRHIPLSHGKKG